MSSSILLLKNEQESGCHIFLNSRIFHSAFTKMSSSIRHLPISRFQEIFLMNAGQGVKNVETVVPAEFLPLSA